MIFNLFKKKTQLTQPSEPSEPTEPLEPTYRFIESVHYDGGRTIYYFDDSEEFMKLVKETFVSEVFIDNNQYSFIEMSNGVVFCLKPMEERDVNYTI